MKPSGLKSSEPANCRQNHQRLVVKIGSSVLLREDSVKIDSVISDLATAVRALIDVGCEVVLVSSGAIATGRVRLGKAERDAGISLLSAVGQSVLTSMYETAFQERGLLCAQILVTNNDIRDSSRLGKLCKTIEGSMGEGVVAVINENNAATHWAGTRRRTFEDNDMLAAIIAGALSADCLILLTDVDGVFTVHPALPGAQLVRNLADAPEIVCSLAGQHGRGGMLSKLRAVRYAVKHGCRKAVIANGRRRSVLGEIVAGAEVGTIIDGGTDA
jgi:glutamate 5-kinase